MLGVNLLPWREQQRANGIRRLRTLLVGVGLVAAITTGVIDYLARQTQNQHLFERVALQQAIERLDTQLAGVARYQDEQQRIQQRLQALEYLHDQRLRLSDLLVQVERALPEGVYLTAVTGKDARLDIHGLARSGALIAQLLRNLSSTLGSVELQQVKAADEGQAFGLSVALRGKP